MFAKVLSNSMIHCDGSLQITCWSIASPRLCIHHCLTATCRITSTASSMMIRSTTPREQQQKSENNSEKNDSNKEETKAKANSKKKKGKRAISAAWLQPHRRIPLGCAFASVPKAPLQSSFHCGVCPQTYHRGRSERDFLPIRTWTNHKELTKIL